VIHAGLASGDATVLWVEIAVLLTLAWLLGTAARRLGQPPIVGSLLAGVLAGPSVFGQVWPAGFHWFRPDTAVGASALGAVAGFVLLGLLISLGAETDLPLIRRMGAPAASVVAGSLILPLAAGAAIAIAVAPTFLPHGASKISFVLLIAAAMAVSSLPVIARIAAEMDLTRRNVGQLAIAAATVNDVVGFVVLAVALAMAAGGGTSQLVTATAGLLGLLAVLALVGQRVVDAALRRTRREGPDVAAGLAVSVVFAFGVAAVAQALGVDAALGAFLAGIVLGRSRFLARRVHEVIDWGSSAVFAPLYFATAGLSVDVTKLRGWSTLSWFLALVAVAVVSKLVGVYVGGRAARLPGRESLALGVALNGRGALQVIIASAGLSAGVLSGAAFAAIILLSLVSSISVPAGLRAALRGWRGTDEEQQRLAHEAEMTTNVVVRGQRLLVPSRGSVNSVAAARILDLAWPEESEVTLLRLQDADATGVERVRASFGSHRAVRDEEADVAGSVEAILAEANLGYGAIGVGAADRPSGHRLLPEFIEELLNRTPIPLVIVRRGDAPVVGGRPLIRPRRILVPVTGNAASRAGQEVAQLISRNTGADMTVLHVVTRPVEAAGVGVRRQDLARASATAVLEDARQRAVDKELGADIVVRDAAFSGEEIDREAQRLQADLIVAGTTVRRVGEQPFLGHTVEHLLENVCGPTVVIVVLPDAQQAAADEHIDRATG
jgi:Kef-type K+ transport system membrane component KefB